MGFPFETIRNGKARDVLMKDIMEFLTTKR